MRNRTIPYIWIIIGLFELLIGINGYIRYSSGGLYLFMIPEQIEVKNILFGLFSIIIGIGLLINPKRLIKLVYSIPFWTLLFVLIGTIQTTITWSFSLTYIVIPDYWFIVLAIFTLKKLKEEEFISNLSFKRFFDSNYLYLVTSGILVNGLIFILAEILPYEIFY